MVHAAVAATEKELPVAAHAYRSKLPSSATVVIAAAADVKHTEMVVVAVPIKSAIGVPVAIGAEAEKTLGVAAVTALMASAAPPVPVT